MKKIYLIPLLFSLSSCATTTNYGAADDILELVAGLRDNNPHLIERHIDKISLKNQAMLEVREIAIERVSNKIGSGLGAQIAAITAANALKPVIEALADEVLSPTNLSYFARQAGLHQNLQMPSRFKASLVLKKIDENRICVPDEKSKQCLLYFGKYPDGWKLNAIDEIAIKARLVKQLGK